MWKQFNINYCVKVKLNFAGRDIHYMYQRDRNIAVNNFSIKPVPFVYKAAEEDEEGYTKWQMWNLMEVFGSCMQLGREMPFDTVILLKEVDLK